MRKVKIDDVAELAGVSPSTVDHALDTRLGLDSRKRVSLPLGLAVIAAAEALDYRPSTRRNRAASRGEAS